MVLLKSSPIYEKIKTLFVLLIISFYLKTQLWSWLAQSNDPITTMEDVYNNERYIDKYVHKT